MADSAPSKAPEQEIGKWKIRELKTFLQRRGAKEKGGISRISGKSSQSLVRTTRRCRGIGASDRKQVAVKGGDSSLP